MKWIGEMIKQVEKKEQHKDIKTITTDETLHCK